MEFKSELQDVMNMLGMVQVNVNQMTEQQMLNVKELLEEIIESQAKRLPDMEVHEVLSDGLPELTVYFQALRCLELMLNPPEPVEEPEMSPQEMIQDYGIWVGHCVIEGNTNVSPRDYVDESMAYGNITRKQIEIFLSGFYTPETTEAMMIDFYGSSDVMRVRDIDLPF